MKVYKFGGASVRDAAGVRRVVDIVRQADDSLVVVVSAMGKTTNALEAVVEQIAKGDKQAALERLNDVREYHYGIIYGLFPCGYQFLQNKVEALLQEVVTIINAEGQMSYDELYDQVVSVGELISTRIVSVVMHRSEMENTYLEMPRLLRTDDTYREAIVDMKASERLLKAALQKTDAGGKQIYIAQGFIGGTQDGKRTTLGREGSDYTAALIANMLNAESVTIWKDVPGILNADPRLVENTVLIPKLSYYDAVELSYSGAQVIHPKTIRPLENKHIPLYVRPFGQPTESGSVITDTAPAIEVPVLIWRKKQVLITVRPNDFGFVLEDSLNAVFDVIHRYRLRVSLIQSSAVTISVSVDECSRLWTAIEELKQSYKVTYNEHLELLTIRGTTPELISEQTKGRQILLKQETRRTARFLMLS